MGHFIDGTFHRWDSSSRDILNRNISNRGYFIDGNFLNRDK